jgi:methyltransferase (TIGR00027 family)
VRGTIERPASTDGDVEGARLLADDLHTRMPLHLGSTLRGYLEVRTRYFDEQVAAADGQVVIVGAGYDDRALRFRRPGVHFVEVDHPDTQRDKLQRLRRLGIDADDITFVPVDLALDDVALALDDVLDPSLPTLVLCEALVPYLHRSDVDRLLRGLRSCPGAGRRLAVELPLAPTTPWGRMAFGVLRTATTFTGETIHTVFAGERDVDRLLRTTGWEPSVLTRGADMGMPAATKDIVFATATAA